VYADAKHHTGYLVFTSGHTYAVGTVTSVTQTATGAQVTGKVTFSTVLGVASGAPFSVQVTAAGGFTLTVSGANGLVVFSRNVPSGAIVRTF
jgi:hypothetical protein